MIQKNSIGPTLQAILAAGLFGASAPLSKLLLVDIQPVMMAGLLYLGSGIAALLASRLRGWILPKDAEARLSRADLPWLLAALLTGGVAAPILLMVGLAGTSGATASLLLNFESVSTTLIAALIFREAIGNRLWIALALITLASILLSWHPADAWGFSWLAVAVLGACLLWGLDNNFTRHISARDPLAIVAIKGLGAGTFSFVLSLVLGESFPALPIALTAMLVGAVCYGVSIALFVLAMRGLGAARTGTLFASAPFIGALLSLLILRETPGLSFYLATPLMLVGVIVLLVEDHAHLHTHEFLEHEHAHVHDAHHPHSHGVIHHHNHPHRHETNTHSHNHAPDLHHRHKHH
ncbi:MAG: EamA family transporter [Anaerolinea sp.]|nr:EamA family transporter [Anaerolinea sp.]